jgi:AcrR family transcriptional regulator
MKNKAHGRIRFRTNTRPLSITGGRTVDRRIQKTERHLHEALSALIREKPYDAIAVKEILARANVGRSTFYTHFRDKDELLTSGIHHMIRSGRPTRRSPPASAAVDVFWFSLPVFAHVDEHRRASEVRMGAKGRATIHGRLEQVVADLVADELKRNRSLQHSAFPPDLLARHIAATFVLVLNWWVESGSTLTAGEINERFLALVAPVH